MSRRTACIALVFSTLNRTLASPVSRLNALNAELTSPAQSSIKHSGPPRGLEDRTGGTTVHTENYRALFLAKVHIVPLSAGQAYAKQFGRMERI
jgi:hypothetical protein